MEELEEIEGGERGAAPAPAVAFAPVTEWSRSDPAIVDEAFRRVPRVPSDEDSVYEFTQDDAIKRFGEINQALVQVYNERHPDVPTLVTVGGEMLYVRKSAGTEAFDRAARCAGGVSLTVPIQQDQWRSACGPLSVNNILQMRLFSAIDNQVYNADPEAFATFAFVISKTIDKLKPYMGPIELITRLRQAELFYANAEIDPIYRMYKRTQEKYAPGMKFGASKETQERILNSVGLRSDPFLPGEPVKNQLAAMLFSDEVYLLSYDYGGTGHVFMISGGFVYNATTAVGVERTVRALGARTPYAMEAAKERARLIGITPGLTTIPYEASGQPIPLASLWREVPAAKASDPLLNWGDILQSGAEWRRVTLRVVRPFASKLIDADKLEAILYGGDTTSIGARAGLSAAGGAGAGAGAAGGAGAGAGAGARRL